MKAGGKKKWVVEKYKPEFYRIAKIVKPTGKDAEFVRSRYNVWQI